MHELEMVLLADVVTQTYWLREDRLQLSDEAARIVPGIDVSGTGRKCGRKFGRKCYLATELQRLIVYNLCDTIK